MITTEQYFNDPRTGEPKFHLPEHAAAASDLLPKVHAMLGALDWEYPIDPDTGSSISGSHGGDGDGGFRGPNSKTGAAMSKHKTGHAVDVFDPKDELDGMLTDEILEEFGLYREHPKATVGWCHLQDVPPKSGKRTFVP